MSGPSLSSHREEKTSEQSQCSAKENEKIGNGQKGMNYHKSEGSGGEGAATPCWDCSPLWGGQWVQLLMFCQTLNLGGIDEPIFINH